MVKKLLLLFATLVLAGGGALIYLGRGPAAPGETAIATMGSVRRAVRGSGRVEGLPETTLSFGMPGRVETVNVREGEEVVMNNTLAELNPSEVEKQIKLAEAAAKEARAEVDLAKTPPPPEAIRQAEEKYEQAKAATKAAELKLQTLENPPKTPPPEQWQLEEADRTVQAAQTQLELAQIKLKKLKAGPNPDDVAVAKAKLDAAIVERDNAKKRLEQFKGGVPLPLLGREPKESKADLEAAYERAEEALKVA